MTTPKSTTARPGRYSVPLLGLARKDWLALDGKRAVGDGFARPAGGRSSNEGKGARNVSGRKSRDGDGPRAIAAPVSRRKQGGTRPRADAVRQVIIRRGGCRSGVGADCRGHRQVDGVAAGTGGRHARQVD